MRITLTVTAGPHKGQVFTFAGHDTFIVGRSKRAHFRLPVKDRYFSRVHFMVEVNPPHCRLMDLRSRNGSYVNGEQVTTADLKHGDEIKAGKTILSVSVEEDDAPVALPVASEVSRENASTPDTFATVKPAEPGTPRPPEPAPAATPRPPVPSSGPTDPCRVCLEPVSSGHRTSPLSRSHPDLPPLCPRCQKEIQNHPQPVPGYHIVREIGRGAMGIVYLALRAADGNLVALKTIIPAGTPSSGDIQRFLREASILRQLDHPHIVAFRDQGEVNGLVYFAMDFVRGCDAGHLLKQNKGPLAIGRAVGLVCQLLDALAYAHSRKFVHRDIKPANILITEESGREVVKLADFGLARIYQASTLSGLTLRGEPGGTPAFMPPEQILNFREAKPPADQYSSAATLYNLLTDRLIYDPAGNLNLLLLMILQEMPVPIRQRREEIPEGLAVIVHRALAREPEQRFDDVQAMRQALLAFGS
jgi:pSer/pThr/pTyr-binding forkhead associated (FHA) protein